MSGLKIENENSLKEAFKRGINLFVGAGFSIEAKNHMNEPLPLGGDLAIQLCQEFGRNPTSNLPQIATILEKTKRAEFYGFLIKKFTVANFPKYYYFLNNINIKKIFTTNIDNLIPEIISGNKERYLHNQAKEGDVTDIKAISYIPLHGSVTDETSKFIFDVTSLANVYADTNRIWNFLSQAIEQYPTVFIGYGLNDSSTIQALTSHQTFNNAHKQKWIMLYQPGQDDIEYYQSLNFSIITGETKDFLEYIGNISNESKEQSTSITTDKRIETVLENNLVPKNVHQQVVRPINEFFKGQAPTWRDVINNGIYKTSYYYKIQDAIYDPEKHVIVTGAPVTGKTTLMMQIAYNIKYNGYKLIFEHVTSSSAEYYCKIIGDEKVLLFVENFTDDIGAFLKLTQLKNAKVVGIDRSHNLNMVNHKLAAKNFKIINVTDLSDADKQSIYDSLPMDIRFESMKKENNTVTYESDSIFEFVIRNIKGQTIKERYVDVLKALEHDKYQLAEFLVLCAYMHSSRVPLSLEVAVSYFQKNDGFYDYKSVLTMREELDDLLKDYYTEELCDDNMDYYYPRSYYIAESIIKSASNHLLRDVMNNVIDKVPSFQIFNYRTFHKHAFDKNLVAKAFPNSKDGKEFYEKVYLYDAENPYILQQGALYLSMKKEHEEAFKWIDKAMTKTSNKKFSIRNSHAKILFEANYNVPGTQAREQLDNSMEILRQCINSDLRRSFHAKIYAEQAVNYHIKYGDKKAITYLKQAYEWLNKEIEENKWDKDLKSRLKDVKGILELVN